MSRSLHTEFLILVMVTGWKPNEQHHSLLWVPRALIKISMQMQCAEMCLKLGILEPAPYIPCPHSGTVGILGQLIGNYHQQIPSERTILSGSLEDPEDWGKDIGGNMGLH